MYFISRGDRDPHNEGDTTLTTLLKLTFKTNTTINH